MRSTLRRLTALALALLLVTGVAACGNDGDGGSGDSGTTGQPEGTRAAKTGGEATMNLTSFPDFLDPALSYTQEGWQSLWTVYTPLLSYKHEEGAGGSELIPGLAEAMPEVSEDGLTYTLKLREGLKYSDGSPAKASDFEHTIQRVLNLESGGTGFYQGIVGAEDYIKGGKAKADIEGIDADDETREITIKLTERDGSFPYVLAMDFAGLVPGDTPFENQTKSPPPGVGPVQVRGRAPEPRLHPGEERELDRDRGHPAAKLDSIKVEVKKNQQRQTQDVIRNRVDYILDPPPADQLREVKAQYKDRYEEFVTNSTYYYFMNTR
jgi:peptide/nickel transport system substrate-binding protein